MSALITLENLGPRICIMGPSNSGKSTLASALARKTALPAIHLDQLYHQPHTDWQPRDEAAFLHLHHQAIHQDCWVMDGNYTHCLNARLARATGYILLDVSTLVSLLRYFRRCYASSPRQGGLEGGVDSVKGAMIKHIALITPANRRRYQTLYSDLDLPKCFLQGQKAIDDAYRRWNLSA
ncbi:adenylate kinase family enzyme [Pantoea allii]|uniref:Adenylate kinase family enzyme n=1 Tax=Pantoea allii TaxID=574096 RepID=A0A2V2BKE6_9GAMM|nr:AAA family ATPase [Pantoea allii]PWK99581.1 adenylate kinase family enzyme [Pantoea allii]